MRKNFLSLALIVSASTLLSGCETFQRLSGPTLPYNTTLKVVAPVADEAVVAFNKITDESARKQVRDEYIGRMVTTTDVLFIQYAVGLTSDKNNLDALVEGSQMTLGVAATMVGGVQAKENLAALITLITGGKAIVDKTYFGDKAVDAFVSTMIAARKEKFLDILKGIDSNTTVYPLQLAMSDVNEYVLAGTPGQAVSFITKEATKRDEKATADIKVLQSEIRGRQDNLSKDFSTMKRRLTESLGKEPSHEGLVKTFEALGGKSAGLTDADLTEQIRSKVIVADTPEKIQVLDTAFRTGQILK